MAKQLWLYAIMELVAIAHWWHMKRSKNRLWRTVMNAGEHGLILVNLKKGACKSRS